MNDKSLSEIISLIEAKYEMTGKRFTAGVEQLYKVGMETLPDATARTVVSELLLTTTWPPTIDEILTAAARYESPTPSEDDAWSEVYARCGLPRLPPWSHPLVDRAVRDLGGANAIWHTLMYANDGKGTSPSIVGEQFRKAYVRRRQEWEREVMVVMRQPGLFCEMRLPVAERSAEVRALFPVPAGTRFHRFAEPSGRQWRSIEARQEERIETPAIPLEEIQAMVAGWRESLRKAHKREVIGRAMTEARKRHTSRSGGTECRDEAQAVEADTDA